MGGCKCDGACPACDTLPEAPAFDCAMFVLYATLAGRVITVGWQNLGWGWAFGLTPETIAVGKVFCSFVAAMLVAEHLSKRHPLGKPPDGNFLLALDLVLAVGTVLVVVMFPVEFGLGFAMTMTCARVNWDHTLFKKLAINWKQQAQPQPCFSETTPVLRVVLFVVLMTAAGSLVTRPVSDPISTVKTFFRASLLLGVFHFLMGTRWLAATSTGPLLKEFPKAGACRASFVLLLLIFRPQWVVSFGVGWLTFAVYAWMLAVAHNALTRLSCSSGASGEAGPMLLRRLRTSLQIRINGNTELPLKKTPLWGLVFVVMMLTAGGFFQGLCLWHAIFGFNHTTVKDGGRFFSVAFWIYYVGAFDFLLGPRAQCICPDDGPPLDQLTWVHASFGAILMGSLLFMAPCLVPLVGASFIFGWITFELSSHLFRLLLAWGIPCTKQAVSWVFRGACATHVGSVALEAALFRFVFQPLANALFDGGFAMLGLALAVLLLIVYVARHTTFGPPLIDVSNAVRSAKCSLHWSAGGQGKEIQLTRLVRFLSFCVASAGGAALFSHWWLTAEFGWACVVALCLAPFVCGIDTLLHKRGDPPARKEKTTL